MIQKTDWFIEANVFSEGTEKTMSVKSIPDGFNTLSPHAVVKDGVAAIEFYKKAFGAEEVCRMPGPDGAGVMHAELRIGNSTLMIAEEYPGCTQSPQSLGATTVELHIYCEDAERVFQRAIDAGATATMPVSEMFWGDRYGKLKDPFGHEWGVATHVEDVTPEECAKRAAEFFSQGGCGEK